MSNAALVHGVHQHRSSTSMAPCVRPWRSTTTTTSTRSVTAFMALHRHGRPCPRCSTAVSWSIAGAAIRRLMCGSASLEQHELVLLRRRCGPLPSPVLIWGNFQVDDVWIRDMGLTRAENGGMWPSPNVGDREDGGGRSAHCY